MFADVPVAERVEEKEKREEASPDKEGPSTSISFVSSACEVAPDQYADENGAEPISPPAPLCCLA